MCGIAGLFDASPHPAPIAPHTIRAMCATVVHRGPDDEGYYQDEGIALGMRRLSIVDVAGGHQPVASDDGRIQLVFNGEIFNHVQLREELKAAGATFRSSSDTEVILRLYEQFGLRAFDRLNGMFAIAISDGRDGSLVLVRDRLGVKPLYYAWDGERIVFASEIKAILAALPRRPEINPRAVWDYFTFRFVPMPHTIWNGIAKLPPAHRLVLRRGDTAPRIEQWWSFPRPAGKGVACIPAGREVDEFGALLKDAVDLRMRADVPVGILLSGGLDSSVVAALAAPSHPRLSTFSVAFDAEEQIDERRWARIMARKLGTDHHEVVIGEKEFTDFLPDFVHYTDEPLADLASIPLYYVSRLAREQVKVVLSGEGSDEILGGYSFDVWARRWDDAAAQAAAHSTLPGIGERFLRAIGAGIPAAAAPDPGLLDLRRARQPLSMTAYMTSEEKERLLAPRPAMADSHDDARRLLEAYGNASPLSQALYMYCQDWLVEDLLMKADKMSMATSLELRTPFLDYRVVEFAFRLSDQWRVGRESDGRYSTKRVLRHLARRLVPDEIIDRPKMGFPVPVYGWLTGRLKPMAHDLLISPAARLRTWCKPAMLAELFDRGTAAEAVNDDRHRLWNAMILEIWLRRWAS